MALMRGGRAVPPARLTRWTGYLLYRAHTRSHAQFQDALAPLGLTPKSFGVLTVIVERGPLSQAGVSEILEIDRTTMVAVVDELQRAGHVERGRDAADRRVHSLQATQAGNDALRAAERVARRMHDELTTDLSEGEAEQLHDLLARIAR